MCQGLILLFDSTSCRQTHCIKSARNQAATFPVNGTAVTLLYVAKRAAKLIFWTTVPVLIGLLVLGEPLLEQLFGPQFVKAYPALFLMVLGQFINAVSGSTGLFMNMTGREVVFRNIVLSAALINIVMNYFLTPRYGIVGAACAYMISISFWNISTLIFTKRAYGRTIGYFPGAAIIYQKLLK